MSEATSGPTTHTIDPPDFIDACASTHECLVDQADLLSGGHHACPGCGEALAVRYVLNTMGPNTVAVVPPSCIAIIAGMHPYSSMRVPAVHGTLESSGAAAAGIKRALRAQGKGDTHVLVMAGDGGTYDIGIQALSGAAERNEDMVYVCMDNEGYMNTGAQKSGSTPRHASTASTPGGKTTHKKNIAEIMAAHRVPYVATASIGYPDDLVRKVTKARDMTGMRFIVVLTPCLAGWGIPENSAVRVSRLAVDSGFFPLFEIEDGVTYTINHGCRGVPVRAYLEAQKRFKHLGEAEIAEIQAEADDAWAMLQSRVTCNPAVR
jgi:pyruvate/2-oxoacid:ferredoxin oxidoreductase beta subunit